VVKLGTSSFKGVPDASLARRSPELLMTAFPTFIVIKDKKKAASHSGEYQVCGEVVAVAHFNYYNIARIPQTIFALRIAGDLVSFYRADIPASYLESLNDNGQPDCNIVIFKAFDQGLSVSDKPDRDKAFTIICSIFKTCLYNIAPHLITGGTTPAPITVDRLKQLQGL